MARRRRAPLAAATVRSLRAGAVAMSGASLVACGLVLGIDDIPSVQVGDAGHESLGKKDAETSRAASSSHTTRGSSSTHTTRSSSSGSTSSTESSTTSTPTSTTTSTTSTTTSRTSSSSRTSRSARPDAEADAKPDHGVDAPVDAALDVAKDGPVGQLPQPTGSQTTSTALVNFAVHYLWFGETDKNASFTPDPSAWATFGYNIDGLVTTATSTDVCTLAPGALPAVQVDGEEGFDNSFGENIVGFLSIAFSGISKDLTTRIINGDYTFLFDTTGLTSSPTQTNQGLSLDLYGGGALGHMPTFTPADNWPVNPATIADGRNLSSGAKTSLSNSYITNGTWVSGDPTDFVFTIEYEGQPLALLVHEGVATFQHTVDDAGNSHAVNGMIAGILKPSELIAALTSLAGGIDDGAYCALVPAFASQIVAGQDIMLDGANMEGASCNGVSIGLAFTADEIAPPSIVAPALTFDAAVPMCPTDAGKDSSLDAHDDGDARRDSGVDAHDDGDARRDSGVDAHDDGDAHGGG